jgi:hypothetical protein
MEEDCGGGQGLNWAVEPRRESDDVSLLNCVVEILSEVQSSDSDNEIRDTQESDPESGVSD